MFPCRKGSLWTWCGRRGSGVRAETRRSRGGNVCLFQASEMIPGVPAKGFRALRRANPYLSGNRRAYRDVEFLLINPESPDKLGQVVSGLLLLWKMHSQALRLEAGHGGSAEVLFSFLT